MLGVLSAWNGQHIMPLISSLIDQVGERNICIVIVVTAFTVVVFISVVGVIFSVDQVVARTPSH